MKAVNFLTVVAFAAVGHSAAYALSLRVSDAAGAPGATDIAVNITVEGGVGVAGGDLTLTYNASVLTAKRATVGALAVSAGLTVAGNTATPGQVKISMASATGISTGSGVLVIITFDVAPNAAPGTYRLELTRTDLFDEQVRTLPLQSNSPGIFTITGPTIQPPASGTGIKVRVGDVAASLGDTSVSVRISVENAKGLAGGDLVLTYETSILTAKQVTAGSLANTSGIIVIGNIATAGQVKISMAGATGSTSGDGVLVNIAFDVNSTAPVGTTDLILTKVELLDETVTALMVSETHNGKFSIGTLPPLPPFSISLDMNTASGDQATHNLTGVQPGAIVPIQIFGGNIREAVGFSAWFEYDTTQVAYEGFEAGDVLPDAQFPGPKQGTNPTWVEIGAAALGAAATSDGGLLGTIRFRASSSFSGTTIRMVKAEILRNGQEQFETLTTNIEVAIKKLSAIDFDGDGSVEFRDFFLFADNFGQPMTPARTKFDLDGDGKIGFGDFFLFADAFGKSGGEVGKLMALAQEYIGLPLSPRLEQNYPNPFNAWTTIRYQVAGEGVVQLEVFDLSGQRVRALVNELKGPGIYEVVWDGTNEAGQQVSSGMYLVRLRVGEWDEVRKVLMVK